mmetsp:Transcript_26118/g.59178  ORF Transcript_26118/g.59178 Transcript_26118/m.59178 type:complete len:225 (+) Transcript_26118:540-1214(+)
MYLRVVLTEEILSYHRRDPRSVHGGQLLRRSFEITRSHVLGWGADQIPGHVDGTCCRQDVLPVTAFGPHEVLEARLLLPVVLLLLGLVHVELVASEGPCQRHLVVIHPARGHDLVRPGPLGQGCGQASKGKPFSESVVAYDNNHLLDGEVRSGDDNVFACICFACCELHGIHPLLCILVLFLQPGREGLSLHRNDGDGVVLVLNEARLKPHALLHAPLACGGCR